VRPRASDDGFENARTFLVGADNECDASKAKQSPSAPNFVRPENQRAARWTCAWRVGPT